ncbi:MAG: hypothetical protein GIW99_11795, partial [Candidatus Eremiobacteraeota bacterium]|nr:hypothetical protein [Candidatus Eremiobacteraeota bacterium]
LLLHQVVDDLFFFPKVAELWWVLMGVGAAHAWQTQSVGEAQQDTHLPVRRRLERFQPRVAL